MPAAGWPVDPVGYFDQCISVDRTKKPRIFASGAIVAQRDAVTTDFEIEHGHLQFIQSLIINISVQNDLRQIYGSTPESVGAKLSELVICWLDFLRHGRTKEWWEHDNENLEPCDSSLGEIILPP